LRSSSSALPSRCFSSGSIRVLSHVRRAHHRGAAPACHAAPPPSTAPSDESIWTRIKEALLDMRTWTSMLICC